MKLLLVSCLTWAVAMGVVNFGGWSPLQIAYMIEPLVDTNNDTIVSVDEMTSFFEDHFDTDHDGRLFKNEFEVSWMAQFQDDQYATTDFFDHLDSNGDGEITYWDLFHHFLVADTNSDWTLTVSELITFLEQSHPHYLHGPVDIVG